MTNAEFEDCYEVDVYKEAILTDFGVDLITSKFRGNGKWSERLRKTFLDQGKPFSDQVCARAKNTVAAAIIRNPKNALNVHRRNSIDALVSALERMVKN